MAYNKLYDQILEIEDEPAPYQALNFISVILIALGWVIIIIGVVITFVLIYIFSDQINEFMNIEHDGLFVIVSLLATIVLSTPTSLLGLFMIAQGQVIKLMLDMRNDLDLSRQYLRLFGMYYAAKLEPPKIE